MKKTIYALLASASLLGGCATSYQPKSFTGGFSEVRLNAETVQISVAGNGYTSTERARNIAVLRAADLTLEAGFSRFIVVGGQVGQEYAGSSPVVVNRVGNTLIATGGDAIQKPSGSMTVRFVGPKDPIFPSAFDAEMIRAQLLPQLAPKS
jgi:hypothetical protein